MFWTQVAGLSDEPLNADHPLTDLGHMVNHQRAMSFISRVPVTGLQLWDTQVDRQVDR